MLPKHLQQEKVLQNSMYCWWAWQKEPPVHTHTHARTHACTHTHTHTHTSTLDKMQNLPHFLSRHLTTVKQCFGVNFTFQGLLERDLPKNYRSIKLPYSGSLLCLVFILGRNQCCSCCWPDPWSGGRDSSSGSQLCCPSQRSHPHLTTVQQITPYSSTIVKPAKWRGCCYSIAVFLTYSLCAPVLFRFIPWLVLWL